MKRNKENAYRIVLATGILLSGCRGVLPGTHSQESPTLEDSSTPSLKLTDTATPTVTPYPELTATPTEEVVPGSEVSRFFPPAFYRKSKNGSVTIEDTTLSIPITLGLTDKLVNRQSYPVKNFELNTADDVALNALAMLYFKAFYEVYKVQQEEPDLTLEEYAKLVANNGGKIKVSAIDETTAEDRFHRDDYFVTITDGLNLISGNTGEFPVTLGPSTYYIGISKNNELILGSEIWKDKWFWEETSAWEANNCVILAIVASHYGMSNQDWLQPIIEEYADQVIFTGHPFKYGYDGSDQ